MSSIHLTRQHSLLSTRTERGRELLQRDLAGLQEQMGTGLRINRASDDAGGYARARKLEALTDRYEQYDRSIGTARNWVNHTQDHLDRMAELMQQAHEQGLRGTNDTFSADEREAFATQIEALRDELIDNLNAKVGGEYLFAGNHTTGEPPFQDDGTPHPTLDLSGRRTRRVGPDLELVVNVDGETVHQTDSGITVVQSLDDLATALRDPAATPPLQEALGQVEVARDHVIDLGAHAGSVARRLDASAEQLHQAGLEYDARRSELEDADYLETFTRFQEKQGRMQAALQVTASVMQTSLLDYLRG